MITFADLMAELGELLGDDLKPDLNQVVTLAVNETLKVQIEPDKTGEFVLLACMVADLPPGRFRENILRDALKTNYRIDEFPEILSYVRGENSLVIFRNIPAAALRGHQLYELLITFTDRCTRWRDAIENGQTSPPNEAPEKPGGARPPMFGFTL